MPETELKEFIMKQFETYIFDLDGTLLYTLDDLTASDACLRHAGTHNG